MFPAFTGNGEASNYCEGMNRVGDTSLGPTDLEQRLFVRWKWDQSKRPAATEPAGARRLKFKAQTFQYRNGWKYGSWP